MAYCSTLETTSYRKSYSISFRAAHFGHLNVNSLRNRFEMQEELIKDKTEIFLISETKLDSSFRSGQFATKGYITPFRLDRNRNGGGLLFYVREDIPCKILKEYTPEKPIENFFHRN